VFKPNASVRERMVSWCLWGVEHSAQIHYQQTRPIPVHDLWGTLPLTTDCSGSTTLFARWAGAPDPNGFDYSGAGSTMDMLAHLDRIPPDRAQPGQHVVVVVKLGTDPVVASHGKEGGRFGSASPRRSGRTPASPSSIWR
jgi:hypothetical protein